MFDKKCCALFLEHMVPKGVPPFETPTATPSELTSQVLLDRRSY